MANISPPKYVRQVLVTLQGRGYPAFLVGGCVRDMLLGVQPHDWDICRSWSCFPAPGSPVGSTAPSPSRSIPAWWR